MHRHRRSGTARAASTVTEDASSGDAEDSADNGSESPVAPAEGNGAEPAAVSLNASGRQLARNVAFSYTSYFVGLAFTLVLTRILLHHLGAAQYGLWIVLQALIGYLGLLDAGVSTAAVQRVARLMAENDREGVAAVIRTGWVFFAASGLVAIVVTVVVAPFLSSILHLGVISPTVAAATLVVLGLMTAVTFLRSVPTAVLFGSGRADRTIQIGMVVLFVTQLGQIAVVLVGGGLVGLALVSTVGAAVGLALTVLSVGRATGTSVRHGHFDRAVLGDLLRFGGLQTVVALAGVVSYQLDALIIGLILPVAQVAPYNVALSTANFNRSISAQGTAYLLPSYAHLETMGDRDRQARYFLRSVLTTMALSAPILVALAAFGDPLLTLWLGSVPPRSYQIMVVLGFVTVLQLPGHQSFLFLTGAGRNRTLAPLAVIGALANLAGSIAATFWLGPVGPAIGSLPTVVVLEFFVLPVVVCRHLRMPVRRYFRQAIAPLVPVVAVAAAAALVLVHSLPHARGLGAVIGAGVIVAVSWIVAVVVISRLEPDIRASVWRRLRRTSR
jgi:O-antigen/teichoic acid export membrane protein